MAKKVTASTVLEVGDVLMYRASEKTLFAQITKIEDNGNPGGNVRIVVNRKGSKFYKSDLIRVDAIVVTVVELIAHIDEIDSKLMIYQREECQRALKEDWGMS